MSPAAGWTLRKHYKTWVKVRGWLLLTYEVVWPNLQQFVAYLVSRLSEQCAKSVPGGVMNALKFFEESGR